MSVYMEIFDITNNTFSGEIYFSTGIIRQQFSSQYLPNSPHRTVKDVRKRQVEFETLDFILFFSTKATNSNIICTT